MEKKYEKENFNLTDYLEMSSIINLINGSKSVYYPRDEEIVEAYKTYEEINDIIKKLVEKVLKLKFHDEMFRYTFSDGINATEISGVKTEIINGETKKTEFCLFPIAKDLEENDIFAVVIDNKFKCACRLVSKGFFNKFDTVYLSGKTLVDESVAEEAKRILRRDSED